MKAATVSNAAFSFSREPRRAAEIGGGQMPEVFAATVFTAYCEY